MGTEIKEKQKCNFCPVSLPIWQDITGRNVTFLSRGNLAVISAPLHVPFCKSLCSKPLLFCAVYHDHQESYLERQHHLPHAPFYLLFISWSSCSKLFITSSHYFRFSLPMHLLTLRLDQVQHFHDQSVSGTSHSSENSIFRIPTSYPEAYSSPFIPILNVNFLALLTRKRSCQICSSLDSLIPSQGLCVYFRASYTVLFQRTSHYSLSLTG